MTTKFFAITGFVMLLAMLACAPGAFAADVVLNTPRTFASLDGSPDDADGVTNGSLSVTGDLVLEQGGEITCDDSPPKVASAGACDIDIDVTGNMVMRAGSAIHAENRIGAGAGGNITIAVGADLSVEGAQGPVGGGSISSSRTNTSSNGPAGDIRLTVANDVFLGSAARVLASAAKGGKGGDIQISGNNIAIDALVQSAVLSGQTGNGANTSPDGGQIGVVAACGLVLFNGGTVSSSGQATGADLVHLEGGCDVLIRGLVESTGKGSAIPANPTSHCYYRTAGVPGGSAADDPQNPRADKPTGATACIEVWSGGSLLIDASDTADGELNADIATGCSHGKSSWIDIYSRSDAAIFNDSTGAFAVHANDTRGANTQGGLINMKSPEGAIFANGNALQANAAGEKSDGGQINVEGPAPVELPGASLVARGDDTPGGGFGSGGRISVRSYAANVAWTDGLGDVTPTGTGTAVNPIVAANRGTIALRHCNGNDTTATSFPSIGTPTVPTVSQACGGAPALPAYVSLP